MKPTDRRTMYEVAFTDAQNVYVVADERHEVIQTIGERYDSDSYSLDWREFEIVDEVDDSLKRAISGRGAPYIVLWLGDDGVRGLENRTNIAGANSLYWI